MKQFLIVLGIAVGAIILLMICAMVAMVILVNSNNAYKGDKQTVLEGKNGKKALVVYQPSLSKVSNTIGESVAKGLNEAGYTVTVSYPGEHLSGDVSAYDVIAMGSTVFAAQPSKLILEYAAKMEQAAGKKVLLYSMGGAAEMPELDTIASNIKDNVQVKRQKILSSDKNAAQAAYAFGLSANEA